MKSIGLYVDGPNVERGLYEAKETVILQNIGNILKEYASLNGDLIESFVFIDEETQWREESTKINYERNGFKFIESKAFKYFNAGGGYAYGKSLTDPAMYCFLIDRLHDEDCPDIFMIITGDKDITVPLEYIKAHEKDAMVVGESSTMSGYLISKCNELGYRCHSLQLISHVSGFKDMLPETIVRPEVKKRSENKRPKSKVRPNQMNPNNIAYWRSRGFSERPEDWEERLKKEKNDC